MAAPELSSLPEAFQDPKFRALRRVNWILVGMLYAFFYMTRYNYTAINAQLSDLIGWNNKQIGLFETVMPLVYGISVFVNGPLADRIGGKRAFLIGAAGVFVMNLLFGALLLVVERPAIWFYWFKDEQRQKTLIEAATLNHGFTQPMLLALLAVVWGINGYFQSFGALAIVKVNAQWFYVSERGGFAAIFGVLIRLGLVLAFSGVPLLATLGLNWAFWIPAAAVGVFFVCVLMFVENTPVDAGLAPVDVGDGAGADDGKPVALTEVLRKVFANPAAWIVAASSMMIGFVRRSVVDAWWPKYMADTFHVAKESMGGYPPRQFAAWAIAILGIAGGFVFGFASERVFQSRRAPVITFGFIGMAVFLAVLGIVNHYALNPWAVASVIAILSFFVNGAHGMIGGAATMDFGGRKAAATAAGLFDGMQYLSAAFVGMGIGAILDRPNLGWAVWPFAPIPFAIVGAIVISRIWNVAPRGRAAH